ncbi:NAD-dependent epimerase/dehydratase family protein [Desulforhabdus sp. TSK]|uniref:NAD-dependent epimerase/dehydratase family protein n=1 Tax=Desulforhabdus sp. TSK TaxID=2925014 RepID=UPI001FC8A555|nr:NAD-dependent epimerase/dehydratase family protein [Desulforhabdus sp. TSK]GKT06782.1 UDP-glucose 4-epimerase-like protein [Desulforhabdus sp. TSK]
MKEHQEKRGCVVTGVAGFVGSHLAERLLSLGHEVVGVDNFFSGHPENMASFRDHPAFNFYEKSIAEQNLLEDLTEKHPSLNCCFHLAAIVSVPYSMDHEDETMELNFTATVRLLQSAEKLQFKRFVFAGSAAEYGNDQRLPLQEAYADENTAHASPYGRAKFLGSQKVASSPLGVALRFFNIYGPRQDPRSPYSGVISRFLDMALAEERLTVFGDGLQARDFVYISDVVDAYLLAGGLQDSSFEVCHGIYNIGTGRSTTILELAEIIKALTGNGNAPRFLPERPGDIRFSLASVEAFSKAAGWRAGTSLRDGLRATLQWYREHRPEE